MLTTINNFENTWNKMAGSVKTAVISSHGSHEVVAYDEYLEDIHIQNLNAQIVEKLILLGCNNGHLDYSRNNPAFYFADKTGGGKVLASDGTVGSGYGDPKHYSSYADINFSHPIGSSLNPNPNPNPNRDNNGWIIYQTNVTPIETGEKKLNMTEMFSVLK